MDSSHPRRHRSWFLAVISSAVLFLGSVVFAASASAAPHDPAHTSQGKSATAHSHASATPRHQTRAGGHTTGGGGSSVNLARPNSFQAQSDPDGMTNGGVDQPGGTGGVDTSAQDGNNGSGNDIDCEDDNRGVGIPGHCKDKTNQGVDHTGDQTGDQTGEVPGEQTGETPEAPAVPGADLPVLPTNLPVLAGQVLTQVSAPFSGTATSAVTHDSAVAGVSTTHAATPASSATQAAVRTAAGVLPNTGAGQALLALLVGGLAALVVGGGLLRRSRATA